MVWGESNSRDFLDWADFCRNNSMRERTISNTGGPNFTSDTSSPQFLLVKSQILDIIQKHRSISIQQLYNVLPPELVANPTVKHLILQLYYEDNLQIKGQVKNDDSRESNFVVIFVKKQQNLKTQPQTNIQRKQSNIEDLIDNNWRSTGRKLEFEKIERKEKLNINLKHSNATPVAKNIEKPNIDVRDLNKKAPIKEPTLKKSTPDLEKIQPVVQNENINYIKILSPEPKKIIKEVQPTITLNLQVRPDVIKEDVVIEDKVFYGLSAFDLYYIDTFLRDSLLKENQYIGKIKMIKQIVKTRADIKFLEEGSNSNIVVNILIVLSCLAIVGIFVAIAKFKNKIKAKAIKSYNHDLKSTTYDNLKKQLKEKHPRIIEF